MKIVIVGGVAGGASAATRLRRLEEQAEIVLFEKGPYISYANCGLPYYLGGTIKEKDRLLVTKPELLRDRFRVDVRMESEVLSIDRSKKTVTVRDSAGNRTYEESYDKLLLSPGAEPKRPPLEGIGLKGIFTLRTVPDTFKIDEYLKENNCRRAVVVGGGFIGVEMAENLRERGLEVTIVEFLDQVVAPLDREMASLLHRQLTENGVELRLGVGVQKFEPCHSGLKISLADGTALEADLVLLSIGVSPDSRLAREAGLETGVGGGIVTDDTFATSDPDIYAVGDAIVVKHLVSGQETLLPLAGPANKQGRAAAENMLASALGKEVRFKGVQGSSVLKVFQLTAASTGLNEKQLKQLQIPYQKTYIHPASHATYYPGSSQISMKLLFSPDGKILGAQAVGMEGVEKRIDVIATVIRLGGTVEDLEELELCYAPPYSSAKDPVNMLGFTAANILNGSMPVIYPEDLETLDQKNITLLDVRTEDEFRMGSLEGAKLIPLDDLRDRIKELDREKTLYLFCAVGLRGYLAQRILLQNGFTAYNLSGGYKTYCMYHDRVQPPAPKKVDCVGVPKPVPAQEKLLEVDACGLQCPGPIMKVSEGMKALEPGERLKIRATDPAFASDISVWCQRTGNQLVEQSGEKGVYTVVLEKGAPVCGCGAPVTAGNDKTLVIFSGDLDKAIAAFIIANGAAAMGRKVTLFFTFWGLNILRKNERISVKKNLIETMFGKMMPRGSRRLGLSRMNMGGMGAKMIRSVMKGKNVESLEDLMLYAMKNGVRVVACQMSMDVMGIRQEELIDGVEIGGVATMLGSAETSDTNLFI